MAQLLAKHTRHALGVALRGLALLFLAVLRVACDVTDRLRGKPRRSPSEADTVRTRPAAKTRESGRPPGGVTSGEDLHAQWSAFMSRVGVESEEPAPPEQSNAGPSVSSDAPSDSDSDGSEKVEGDEEKDGGADAAHARYKRYARAAAVAGGEGDDEPQPAAPQLTPEEEVDRLLRLREGPQGAAGAASRVTFGRGAWLAALRVKYNASHKDVAKAHRRLSARVHPDKCAHPRAGEAQAVLNQARDGLLGVNRRHNGFFSPERRRPGAEDDATAPS